ncbi:hypothetical protein HYALB_00009474 [Hymenoscyphus albidus]|uniref:Uncharacterized protein n=1 Tax=Hymenoscyphus albidus TaxID=595503 RepID=A0A9N9LYV0_9HELO|nr:hypothetical protein HYALB_00009474 [Hymenoscyphus albidus]
MRIQQLVFLGFLSIGFALPVAEPKPAPAPQVVDYGEYGAYGSYANYPPPPPAPTPSTGYGTYAGYGTYKREAEAAVAE